MAENNTSRMLALLAELRRDMNGVAADAMLSYGGSYGVNYGVAAHTIRKKAEAEPRDHAFAEYLYRQDVRELRIAGVWIARPEEIAPEDFGFWAAGIINSEMAEQAAMALLSRIGYVDELLDGWSRSDDVLLCYAAMLAAARNSGADIETALLAVGRIVASFPDNRLAAQGAVALLAALAQRDAARVAEAVASLPQSPTAEFVRDEMAWRLEASH